MEPASGVDGGILVVDRASDRALSGQAPGGAFPARSYAGAVRALAFAVRRDGPRGLRAGCRDLLRGSGGAHRGEPADRPRDRTEGAARPLTLPPLELVVAALRQQGRDADHEKAAGHEHADEEFGVAETGRDEVFK